MTEPSRRLLEKPLPLENEGTQSKAKTGIIMLIARQRPTATRVAGIRTWNSLGGFVKHGEKGILILAPMVGRKAQPRDEIATEIETANTAEERKAIQELYGFRAVYVFDVDQTESKELPSLTDVRKTRGAVCINAIAPVNPPANVGRNRVGSEESATLRRNPR